LTPWEFSIISTSARWERPLEIHEVGVQPLLRGGQMLQQDAALPVEANAFHDHAGQEPETSQIDTAGGEQHSEPAAGHHRALTGGVHGRRLHASHASLAR